MIAEQDWRSLRQMQPALLDRLCNRSLAEMLAILNDSSLPAHERYFKISTLTEARDLQISRLFDNIKRSNAVLRLTMMKNESVITNEDLANFSTELRSLIEGQP
jgi:hypothetical protein